MQRARGASLAMLIAAAVATSGSGLGGVPPVATADGTGGVSLELLRTEHAPGVPVEFRISNRTDSELYYRFGCERPRVHRLEDDGEIPLTLETDEALPDLRSLRPGEVRGCRWDQRAWQAASGGSGRARFESFDVFELVPTGRYRLSLVYHANLAEVDDPSRAGIARSAPLTIR